MGLRRILTIGVYTFDSTSFIDTLREAGVDMLVDVRLRRGVRGRAYAWANKERLMALLADAGIAYRHERGLAPTHDILRLQHVDDDAHHVSGRSRTALSTAFRQAYGERILDAYDFAAFRQALPETVTSIALLCVETAPEVCHRSLVAGEMARQYGLPITHLRP